MTVDNTKLLFNSNWDIDQLLYQGQINGIVLPGSTSSQTNVLLFNFSLAYPPVIDGTFQVSGDTVWRQFGDSTTSGLINLETFIFSTPSGVFVAYYNFNVGSITINVRYFVWTDKINY